ncbi:peptidoglycan-binding protein [Streptomyces sp. A1136]|uniref:peptidoglycan-binding domain-containing protein n=1 Tax=Streptomyces sp. A1136 TaxID=2563102 RepID=UPI00109ECB7E|nr:peptidoglycan-binding domain-containing protein [Streptomyces sp. A1136]THA54139.1 peptidoglycan-binding protein [Streptomyces sp. A1136]
MTSLNRTAASAAFAVSLLIGATALSTGPAAAVSGHDLEGVHCGFDARLPPPSTGVGSTGDTVKEAQCLLEFWTGVRTAQEEAGGVFGASTASSAESFQGLRGLPRTGVIDAATWAELRHS